VPELRVLMMFFAIFFHGVAWGGARWDPIALLAREHIGITRYGKCIVGLNLEAGLSFTATEKQLGSQHERATARRDA
jgi:hypothetical protein